MQDSCTEDWLSAVEEQTEWQISLKDNKYSWRDTLTSFIIPSKQRFISQIEHQNSVFVSRSRQTHCSAFHFKAESFGLQKEDTYLTKALSA